ncbi:MAG: replicative DNA helicase [Gemmatimonadetes bacterium]|uniref:Replicative DNA helicase n=1 Tax=Candidatus Kutchimonas denitrificans TaxID=3056748 RepID=A0AAE5CB12_9BACT|nr:replicative DNA helicase [Gemmatimonadota bacterium]NIR75182.1 replicative DNA helicase [Candidatus Kutchimonas denitrificans]NIS00120.1 replicative DNA helicase [Gemmatimonadota bacterium]NIT65712.1 replicative DNA helicase [Gemmatimonadota bacterium]NIU52990.1 replicative DNA helicase [Gemmatimonadota bacterium]
MPTGEPATAGGVGASDAFTDRQAPWSPEAETSVLGGMLIDADAVAKAVELVDDSMFYREANRRLYRAMKRLFERGSAIDPVTLIEELRGSGELEAVGGPAYLAELMEAVATAANIEYHARIVKDKALLRRLIEVSTETIQEAYRATTESVEDAIDRAEQRIFQVSQAGQRKGFVWIKEILWPAFEHIEQLQQAGGGVVGVPSGFPDLDNMTAGFQAADLIVVAGRPSMGKTSLVLNFMQHAAIEHETPVAFFSLEMSKEAIVQRLLCSEGQVNSQSLRRGKLSEQEYMQLATAAGHLNTAPIWIDDTPAITALELRAKARRLKAEVDLGLIVVDYLQLMRGPRAESRVQEISAISGALKAVAKELHVPVIALSQLSRQPEQRQDKRPQLSDLRESGAIEQDADLVLFLYRPEVYASREDLEATGESLEGKAELIIGKQRNGPTGSFDLFFRKEFTRFESVSRRSAESF